MSTTLLKNISLLVGVHAPETALRGKALAHLPQIEQAWLLIEDDVIAACGKMTEGIMPAADEVTDVRGAMVLPAWCDSHTHLVFAASRESEFIDKIKGLSYAEIAARGGGILNSARRLQTTSEDELFNLAYARLQELTQLGTGAVEIKSGYGLTVEAELKMLRVIRRLRDATSVPIRATFLGAHAFPPEYQQDQEGYIRLLIEEMLPRIATDKLADYIDVFCEKGFFSPEQMERICRAGMQVGLKPKLHVNQLNSIGGIETAISLPAISADHLETMTDQDIRLLAASPVIGTLLPGAAFFLRMAYQPGRQLADAGCALALASDFNPGSCPSGNMNFMLSLACIQLRLLPEEAINAATINGAFAMDLQQQVGSIAAGKKANLIITKPVPSLAYLPYAYASNLIGRVMINGTWISD